MLGAERKYAVLKVNSYSQGAFELVPLRHEDRYAIMQWRNEQIHHLRQSEPLTKEKQDGYFENVVARLFDQEQPGQVLFSFLSNGECIGYGGLVHINWIDQTAEISFVMNTALQEAHFEAYWTQFLQLLKKPAFVGLNLHKIYTYAFDIRPRLYVALAEAGFIEEARLTEHCCIDGAYKDVLIHSMLNPRHGLSLTLATSEDVRFIFELANDPSVRAQAINTGAIAWDDHVNWFSQKLRSSETKIYIARAWKKLLGQVRLDRQADGWLISYSIVANQRGLGLGTQLIAEAMKLHRGDLLKAQVRNDNVASMKVFEKLGFEKRPVKVDTLDMFEYTLRYE